MAKEPSIFVDESGDRAGLAHYYLLTLVFHNQAVGIMDEVRAYESRLAMDGLPDIPFHSEPFMNGHKEHSNLDISQRKRMFTHFFALVRRLPISYYHRRKFDDLGKLAARMKRTPWLSPSLIRKG